MKIGYPCTNLTIGCKSSQTFRLKSYSEKRFLASVKNNLYCLQKILEYNIQHNILFFRISSDLVPFASHPICQLNWQKYFKNEFKMIGNLIVKYGIRISMHPDQFILINSLDERVFNNSLKELIYHTQVLDLMELDSSAKIQLHIGGVYGEKERSMKRFIDRFRKLDENIRRRIVIENDDKNYNLKDALQINAETGSPILFDFLHHKIYNSRETIIEAFRVFTGTWKENDGIPMVDYSSQQVGEIKGKHMITINLEHFRSFLKKTKPFDFDIMLEIKDKEKSALKAIKTASSDIRFKRIENLHLQRALIFKSLS